MEFLDLAISRRSVKEFLPKPVSWEKLSTILEAGRYAPSSGNLQNWKFILVLSNEQKMAVAKIAHEQYFIAQASALIVVCAEPQVAQRYYGLRGDRLYTVQNCAAAIQNMLLQAQALGLGSCWIGSFGEDALKDMLAIPIDVRAQAIIAIGHAKETPGTPPKYPLENITYFGSWRLTLRDPANYLNDLAGIFARKTKELKTQLTSLTGKNKD